MPDSKVKLLLSQLRHENLRAMTSMSKTHALLAEMELLVVQKQLDTMKPKHRLKDPKHPSRSVLRKFSVKSKTNAKSRTKPTSDSSQSTLHRLDKKSKTITKTASTNIPYVTCVSKFAKSLNSLQLKKQSVETQKYPAEYRLENKNSEADKTDLETPSNMEQDGIVNVTTPTDSEVYTVNYDEHSSDSKSESSDTLPNISTSPIARKIFGIANYNVADQEKAARSKKDCSKMSLQESSRIATPKTNLNRSKPHKKAIETSLEVPLRLKNKADKENFCKQMKLAIEDTKRDNENKQNTENTPPLKVSNKENKVKRSKLSNKNTKKQPSLKVSLPLLSKLAVNKKVCRMSPVVDLNKIQKDKKQRFHRQVIEVAEEVEKSVIKEIEENKTMTEAQPIRLRLSVKNTKTNLQIQEISNYVTVGSKQEQNENERVKKTPKRVSLPLSTTNLKSRAKESCMKHETADNCGATNAVFKQIMMKKETADKPEDTRSISSNETALLCTICQCLHETNVCPNQKYFLHLGVDSFETET